MAPSVREVLNTSTAGSTATLVTGAGTAVGDVLVCFHGSDWYTAAGMDPPTGTAGTWTLRTSADLGTNNSHLKVYTRKVTSGGAQTVSVDPVTDEECWNGLVVVADADADDPVDDAAGAQNASASLNHSAPSVAPSTSDALLICVVLSEVFRLINYTGPSGMTKHFENDRSSTMSLATVSLSASGATGTKTFSSDTNCGYVSASIAIQAASAAPAVGPRILVPSLAAVHRAGRW